MLTSLSTYQRKWSLYLIPMNACCSGLATIIPLYLLQLGGGIRWVAIAIFMSNLAVTLGAIFWGKLIDYMGWRKTIIAISSVAIAAVSISMYFVSGIPALIAISALVGFFSVGPGPVTNLLIMEKIKRQDWIKEYSWTSLISAAGLVVAMVAGYVWLMYYDIQSYALVCSAIAISSLGITLLYVKDPPRVQRKAVSIKKIVDFHRIVHAGRSGLLKMHNFDLARAGSRMADGTMDGLSKKRLLYFAGIGIFFLSGNLLFTPFTPFLKENNISDSEVFLAYTVLHLSKVVFLPFNNKIVGKIGEERMGVLSYIPRVVGIAMILAAALLFMGNPISILAITLVAFVAVDVGFSLWNTTTSSSFMKIIPSGKEGSMFGISSSVTGAGLLVGSVMSGEITALYGYDTNFAVAIGALAISLLFIKKFYVKASPAELTAKIVLKQSR